MIKWFAVGCFLLFALIVFPFFYQPDTSFSARCIKVFDCKRIIVWTDSQWFCNRMKIRLNDIQCPERNTIVGKLSRDDLKKIIYGKMIDIEIVKHRFWGWSDAFIYYNGECLNSALKTKWN